MSQTYTIKLPQFEGPFDLLLFFIERDELDIHDIPIAKITDDFLAYIRQMESLNIDLASEFILVAATLMRIKAKLLLPRKELDEEGNEIDPREELVQRLLEYKRYKSVLEEFKSKESEQAQKNPRGGIGPELKDIAEIALVDVELESLTLFKMLKAFERVVQRVEERKRKSVHKVYRYNHTVQGQQIYLMNRIKLGEKREFQDIFGACENRIHAVITFLALLELISRQKVYVTERTGVNNFWVERIEKSENEDDGVVAEDWTEEDERMEDFKSEEE